MKKKTPKKIVFTGPESSGKTTLTQLAAKKYNTHWLPEYSRTYLHQLERAYTVSDLIPIAQGQCNMEQQFLKQHKNQAFVFLDTSFLVLKAWSIFKYGFYNIKLEHFLQQNLPDLYFLCDWQIPWEYDPLRENPNDRAELYALYQRELKQLNVPFYELQGSTEEQLEQMAVILNAYK